MAQKTIDNKKPAQRKFEEVEDAAFFKFENIGDVVEGKLVDRTLSDQYKFGIFTLEQDDGNNIRFHGAAQLDPVMLSVKIGEYIKVEYVDNQKRPKGDMKVFKVHREI
jgi:hypothetical protein